MLESFFSTLLFASASFFLFFLPGWFVLRFILSWKPGSSWETGLLSFGLSIGIIDITLLLLDRFGFSLDRIQILLGITGLLTGLFFLRKVWFQPGDKPLQNPSGESIKSFSFSQNEGLLFLGMLIITLFLRTLTLMETTLPTATDLGHHMYWVQKITLEHTLPKYEKRDLHSQPDGSVVVTEAHPIADFIIGEHLPIATLSLFTKQDVFSALAPLFLAGISLASIFACLTLLWIIGIEFQTISPRFKPTLFVLITFLLLGPLYSLASPQMKFVTGGVIGNLFGNFFIPLILFVFFRAFKEENTRLFGIGIFFSFILAYTHHLSTLVLVFILLGILLALTVLHLPFLKSKLISLWKMLRNPFILMLLVTIVGFILFVAVPSYLRSDAVNSALGTPTKTTRTGLSFFQVTNSVGLGKLALGLAGLTLLTLLSFRKNLGSIFLIGWTGILMVMTLFPQALLLDIPSNRIGSYLIYPLAATSAWLFVWLTNLLVASKERVSYRLPFTFTALLSVLILTLLTTNGWYENGSSFPDRPYQAEAVLETFRASTYLANQISQESIVLKDHNYLVGDTWMKIFFQKDYNFPLSRGFFSRYTEGGSRREQCTLIMISAPNTPEAIRCFTDTQTEFVIVNPKFDSAQFEKSRSFAKIFSGSTLAIYQRIP